MFRHIQGQEGNPFARERDCVRKFRLHSGGKLGKLASGDGCTGKSTEVMEPVRKQGASPEKKEEDVEQVSVSVSVSVPQ